MNPELGAACLGRASNVLRSFARAHAACGPITVAAPDAPDDAGLLLVVVCAACGARFERCLTPQLALQLIAARPLASPN